jgi:acetylornithine/succinyldiaminopimelate/putrescine aminotransferase
MESAEFAIRMAAEATQRSFIIGFEGSMHGKSLATAALGWPRTHVQAPNGWVRLPLVESSKEDALLNHLKEHLQTHRFAAVFVEPILGSAKGLRFTHGFLREVCALAASNGTLVIVDEILSGFYRAGEPFQFAAANVTPDIVLIGKAIGNGFPVSAVVARRDFHITPAMLPNSTYSGNPLACAAIVGTLEAMSELDMPGLTNRIQETIRSQLQPLTGQGWGVRGSGALWFVFPQHPNDMARRVNELWRRGVCVSYTRNFLRVMPSVLIEVDRLRSACHEVCDVLSTHK